MSSLIQTSIYHDVRRPKKDGTYPVKLRVYDPVHSKSKLYALGLSYSRDEFDKIWNTSRPKGTFKDERLVLQEIESRAVEVLKGMSILDFKEFERKFFRRRKDGTDVFYHFRDKIEECNEKKNIGTAENYRNAMNSFKSFLEVNGNQTDYLAFTNVDGEWLNKYEEFMLDAGRSLTTVSIYIRALRAIFHKAIDEREIERDLLPFGKRKYVVPVPNKKKSALDSSELALLFNAQPESEYQDKARDFFFLSYTLNGMNMSDIARLKWKDLESDSIKFVRTKTARSTRGNQQEISVPVSQYARTIIEKYAATRTSSGYLFPIMDDTLDAEENRRRVKNFVRFINQHISILAKKLGINKTVSYNMARHSFATTAIRKGYSIEFVGDSLGHSSIKTTQHYFKGFEDETKKEIAEKMLDF